MNNGVKELRNTLNNLSDFYKKTIKEHVLKIGIGVNSTIYRRVFKEGIGSNGRKLKKYSKSYAEYKKSRGRQTSHRDLHLTGTMWSSRAVKALNSGYSAKLYFGEAEVAAENEKRSPFFSITKKEDAIIDTMLNQALKEIKL